VPLSLGFLGVRGHSDGSESEFLDHPTLPEGTHPTNCRAASRGCRTQRGGETHSTNCRAATHLKRGGVCCADG